MALNPNIRWPSTTRSRERPTGPQPQYQWPSEERILTQDTLGGLTPIEFEAKLAEPLTLAV